MYTYTESKCLLKEKMFKIHFRLKRTHREKWSDDFKLYKNKMFAFNLNFKRNYNIISHCIHQSQMHYC